MKRVAITLAYVPILLLACTSNHYHDGKYRTTVFSNPSWTWVNDEEVEIRGNEMYYKSSSSFKDEVLSEYKTSCIQYPDRIEFKGKNGITVIARFDQNGNLKYGDYIYEKVRDDDTASKKPEIKPLIKENENGTITFLGNKEEEHGEQINDGKTAGDHGIKTYSDGDVSYDYVSSIAPSKNEVFFQGTKSFGGHIDDVYRVTVDKDKIKIYDEQSEPSMIFNGFINGGRILGKDGNESKFRYLTPNLYYYGNNNQWYVFYELKDVEPH